MDLIYSSKDRSLYVHYFDTKKVLYRDNHSEVTCRQVKYHKRAICGVVEVLIHPPRKYHPISTLCWTDLFFATQAGK